MISTLRHLTGLVFLALFALFCISLYSIRSNLSGELFSILPVTSPSASQGSSNQEFNAKVEVEVEVETETETEVDAEVEVEVEVEELGIHDDIASLPVHYLLKTTETGSSISIVDNFPRAAGASSPSDLPPIPYWNKPPLPHLNDSTPLFIGFTRNWRLLQQTVISYITSGWPASDIYVVENTGTMNSNRDQRLSLQNPFYLDYNRLVNIFEVNVISTPTLLTFAQLQNFYLNTALNNGFNHFFWSHMDVAALSEEDYEPYESLYRRSVKVLRETLADDYARDEKGRPGAWAIRFFAYDRLALVNVAAFEAVGGWDTLIPFYGTDCDMHSRLHMAGWKQEDASAGLVYDLSTTLNDLETLYRRKLGESSNSPGVPLYNSLYGPPDERGLAGYTALRDKFNSMQIDKNVASEGRNSWQARQHGGKGEPYYRDSEGFEKAIEMTIEFGRTVFSEKWGHRDCDLEAVGLTSEYAWRLEHDWDRPGYMEALERLRKKAREGP